MSEKPLPAVKAIIEEEGKILVLRTETDDDSFWVLPGGKIEYGETPVEALERELEEEISVKAEIEDSVGMYHFYTREGKQVVLTAFEAEIGDQKIDISTNPADEDISEYKWMKPEELIQKTSNESLAELIENYFSGQPKE